jgi:TPR repeat protein
MSSWLPPSSLLVLLWAQAALAQPAITEGYKCEQLLRALPVWNTPEMQLAYGKPEATLDTMLQQIDALATAGNAEAQHAIGRMMQLGVCAEQNTAGALAYLTRAAEGGVQAAQQVLAEAYYAGKDASASNRLDIPADPVRSYMWFRVLGNQRAIIEVRKRMVPTEVDQAERLASQQLARQAGTFPAPPK